MQDGQHVLQERMLHQAQQVVHHVQVDIQMVLEQQQNQIVKEQYQPVIIYQVHILQQI